MNRGLYFFGLLFAALFSVFIFFYKQFLSGFEVIFGNAYDGSIEAVLVGHWLKVFQSIHDDWRTPFFFYPIPGSLGYNDSYFLFGLLSAPFRLAGVDIFRSLEYTHITAKLIGFFSMAALINEINKRQTLSALIAAALFTTFINSSAHAYHGQLLSVAFAPLLFLLGYRTISAINEGRASCYYWAAGAATAFACWLLTSFYMAWFFVLFCLVLLLTYLALDRRVVLALFDNVKRMRAAQLVAFVGFSLLLLVPFLLVYIPKLKETGGHSYFTSLYYGLIFPDLLNGMKESLVWSPLAKDLAAGAAFNFRAGEYHVGFTPGVLAALLACLAFSGAWFINSSRQGSFLICALTIATLACIALPLKVHDHYSIWWVVFHFVPGASGMRVIGRFWIFLSFPISLLVGLMLSRFENGLKACAALLALGSFLVAEQVNLAPPTELSVGTSLSVLAGSENVPAECLSFFTVSADGFASGNTEVDSLYRHNVMAMLIADRVDKPTLNGFASFLPPNWDLAAEPSETYISRVDAQISKYGLDHVCQYHIKNKEWQLH